MDFREHHLLQILKRYAQNEGPLDLFLSRYFRENKALGSKDRRFVSDTIYGIIRWQPLLDYIGGYPTWERRYATYKKFDPQHYLAKDIPAEIKLCLPKDLFTLLQKQYGEASATNLAEIFQTQAPITLRANTLKTTRAELHKLFPEALITSTSPWGLNFTSRLPFFEMEAFRNGLFEMQDEGSQLVALQVEAKPKEKVLDYCAGSGGKTLGLAPQLAHSGQIFLHDIRPGVLEQAKKRLHRAGIQNAQIILPDHPNLQKLKKKMDWVLADVPCSGTGTYRRNPEMKLKFTLDALQDLVSLQRVIFEKALSFVRPGGHIVYATCSLLASENEDQIAHFLKTYPLTLVKEPFVSLPTLNGMDGFFAATLQKHS